MSKSIGCFIGMAAAATIFSYLAIIVAFEEIGIIAWALTPLSSAGASCVKGLVAMAIYTAILCWYACRRGKVLSHNHALKKREIFIPVIIMACILLVLSLFLITQQTLDGIWLFIFLPFSALVSLTGNVFIGILVSIIISFGVIAAVYYFNATRRSKFVKEAMTPKATRQ